MELNKRQKDFCKYKAKGYSNVESALKAGYTEKTAKTKAHQWLDKSKIKVEIERLKKITQKIADEKFGINQEWIVKGIQDVIKKAGSDTKPDYHAQLKGFDMLGKISGIYLEDNNQKSIENKVTIEIVE